MAHGTHISEHGAAPASLCCHRLFSILGKYRAEIPQHK